MTASGKVSQVLAQASERGVKVEQTMFLGESLSQAIKKVRDVLQDLEAELARCEMLALSEDDDDDD